METGTVWTARQKLVFRVAVTVLVALAIAVGNYLYQTTRQKHVTLTVDGEALVYQTRAETVGEFLQDNSIAVAENDVLTPAATTPITDDMTIELNRSWPVSVVVDGQTKVIHTAQRDVADILREAGITLRDLDRVTPAVGSIVAKDTPIVVTRVEEKEVKVEEEVPFQEIRKADASLEKGASRVLQKGEPGKAVSTYKIVLENGKEVSRELVSRDVVRPKQDRIVAVGTKSKTAVTAASLVSRGGVTFRPKKVLSNVVLTAYSPAGGGKPPGSPGYGRTATGIMATEGRTIAVDPSVIPLGWWVYIDGIGYRRAEDTGGAVKGNKIDIFFSSDAEAIRFGRKRAKTVYVIGPQKP